MRTATPSWYRNLGVLESCCGVIHMDGGNASDLVPPRPAKSNKPATRDLAERTVRFDGYATVWSMLDVDWRDNAV